MIPEQRARKRELIEAMRSANIEHVRLTLDEATYLLDCADLPDVEKRLEAMHSAVLVDRDQYKLLYEREKIRADKAQERYTQAQAELAGLRVQQAFPDATI